MSANAPLEPLLLSVNDAATMLGMSRPTLYKLLSSGALRAVKSGGRTMIPTQALREYVDALPPFTVPATAVKEAASTPAPPSTTDTSSPLLPLREVMKRTGLPRNAVYTRSAAGTFPARFTISKGVLGWRETDVDAWIADPSGYQAKP